MVLIGFVFAMMDFYDLAVVARLMDIPCVNEPDVFKREALKYAKMFGDIGLHFYNERVNN